MTNQNSDNLSLGTQNITTDDILNRDILDLMGQQNMTDREKEELYKKMYDTIQTRVIARIDDQLSDKEAAEWKIIVEKNDKQKNQEFLQSKNIDLPQLYAQETLVYKMEMVELAKLLNQKKNVI